jgi:periplasmic protein TonB
MSTARPSASPPSSRFRLSKRAWWFIGGAFGLGFLLFFLLWLDMRNNGNFYRAEPTGDGPAGQVFEPLPTPQNHGEGRSVSGLSEAAREIAANPSPPPPPAAAPVDTPARPVAPINDASSPPPASQRPSQAMATGSVPQPIERVQPKYPAEAMRRNETGTVLVRLEVGADGEPTDVSIARSSRSRALDRAAMQAARQWRFRPAQRDGQAVSSTVEVPFEFALQEQ